MSHILVLCNGEAPNYDLFTQYYEETDLFIAADGGGNIALSMGYTPNMVIGDLDSFDADKSQSIDIIQEVDQEQNDLEKALNLAHQKQGSRVSILGATGHRLDQTLKNLSVLKQYNDTFEHISLIDNYGKTQLLPPYFQQKIAAGTNISLFPLSGKVTGITTSGLKYALTNEKLENGVRDGSSNEVVSNPVQIDHQKGDLLLFISHFD